MFFFGGGFFSHSAINLKELKTCLYSLGEEKGPKEIEAIMNQYGSKGVITYDGFREFMIATLGDTDTKDEIVSGFKLINKGDDSVTTKTKMANVMKPFDVDYVASTAPAKGDGYDYKAWVESVFSR